MNWSKPLSGRFLFWAGALALIGFTASWLLLGFDWHVQHPDVGFYQSVGEATVAGQVPYRDFDPAYPPAALPLLVLPSLLGARPGIWESYAFPFENLMFVVGILFVLAVLGGLAALDASRRRTALALGLVTLTPIFVGSILPARFDLWPAALTTAALAAIVAGRDRIGSATLGLAIAAKVYPIVVTPLVLLYLWKRRGSATAARSAAIVAATCVAIAVPFLVLAPGGLLNSLHDFAVRPLQVESVGAAVLWAAHEVAGIQLTVQSGFGSQNLVGPLPDTAVAIQNVVLGMSLLAIWAWFARRARPSDQQLIAVSAAAVCAYVAFGKVLSGQYVIWLIPLVALLDGRRAVVAGLVLAVALLLMQQWYPARYPGWIAGLDPGVSWIVLARDLTLLGLLATLVVPAEWFAVLDDFLAKRLTPMMGGLAPERATVRSAGRLEPGRTPVQATFIGIPERFRKER